METYQAFLDRINSFETKEICFGNDYFMSNPSVAQKVDENNKFKEFYGDTVVFNLDDSIKTKLSACVDTLYQAAPECFCERLGADTFHMTLHDLSNSPTWGDVSDAISENESIIRKSANQFSHQTIKMRSNYIFNMVNTSLVLGLYPVNEEEYHKLMRLYCLFDDVRKLDYPLTPHITLAYYNRNGFSASAAGKLETVVCKLNCESFEITLDTTDLYYQKFTSMNDYRNIINLVGNIACTIHSHDITLTGDGNITLKPLTDAHLPLLYQWNSDLEVLFWSEGADIIEPYDEKMVQMIYGSVSANAHCFLIEHYGIPVGECWLQKMNLDSIIKEYSADTDIRRVDYYIGSKEHWGQGIGTECLKLLLHFAFDLQNTDVLYILPLDYNIRSIRMIERAGFKLMRKIPLSNSQKANYELQYRMTKDEYAKLL